MAAVGFLFVLFTLVLTVGGGLVLYSLVRSERDQRTTMDRETAERLARKDSGDEDGDTQDAIEGNHWR